MHGSCPGQKPLRRSAASRPPLRLEKRGSVMLAERASPGDFIRLTDLPSRHTIARMQRETLVAMLSRAEGARLDGDRYHVREDHEITVYMGQPGRAVAIDHVLSITLTDSHVEIEARDRGTFFAAYDVIHALLDARRKERGRGNSGNVGF
jgi:hypothetical protein